MTAPTSAPQASGGEGVRHTPGPWRLDDPADDIGVIVDANYHKICAGKGHSGDGFDLTGFISEANARLIAATPELLAAAQALIALRDNTEMTHEDAYRAMFKSSGRDQWDALEAAIAKALGQ